MKIVFKDAQKIMMVNFEKAEVMEDVANNTAIFSKKFAAWRAGKFLFSNFSKLWMQIRIT